MVFEALSKLNSVSQVGQVQNLSSQQDFQLLKKNSSFENRIPSGHISTNSCDDKSDSAQFGIDSVKAETIIYPEVKLLLSLQKIAPSTKFFKKSRKTNSKKIAAKSLKNVKSKI
jgi:hypothetical protein